MNIRTVQFGTWALIALALLIGLITFASGNHSIALGSLAVGLGLGLGVAITKLSPTHAKAQKPDAGGNAEQALFASEQRLAFQSEALTKLTATGARGSAGYERHLQSILESCSRTLDVARVSMWQFADDRNVIRCVDLFDSVSGRHVAEGEIARQGHAVYFEALERERVIAAHDAHHDPRTKQFSIDYLRPHGIGAMLDVPLRQGDLAVGVLCLEHVGATRTWTVDEQNFALSVANLVAAATAEEDRRQAVQQLAESESRSRLVIDTATDAFVAMDSDGTIVGWNLQSERTFGWSRQEAIGRLLVETIVPQNYRDLHIRGLERFHKTGEAPVVNKLLELTALHRSGKEFPIELAITEPIRSGNGFYFGAFLRDISERRLRERELQNAKEAAEAAARAKSEFLANMSHELRTPLNGVLGYAQLLRRDRSLSSANLDAIESISTCGEHLLNLINDVLDLSKIEAGRVEIDAESTDLRELIADLRLLVTESARAKGLALEFMIASDLPNRVVIDGRHLRQVLLNLISNAVKFTERGSVRLTITRLESSICFEVIDTGIGIDDQDLESIFEAFRQGGAAATRGGTGLGLTISRRLVRAMGGEIRVKSKRDSGSRFWFLVPLVPDTRPEEPHAEEASRDLRLSPGQDATVLVVDDSTINRRIMASLLESGGIKALHAASGLDGVRIAQEQRPDLILMDVRMSDIDGFEATRRIRSNTSTATIPVIAVTASPDAGNRDLALAAGCNGFLAKPLKASELYGILSHELNLKFEPLDKSDKAIQASARSIPVPLADRITRAAHMGDLTELHALAKELMSGEKPAADAGRYVSKLANAFEFEAIERWIAESRNERGSGE